MFSPCVSCGVIGSSKMPAILPQHHNSKWWILELRVKTLPGYVDACLHTYTHMHTPALTHTKNSLPIIIWVEDFTNMIYLHIDRDVQYICVSLVPLVGEHYNNSKARVHTHTAHNLQYIICSINGIPIILLCVKRLAFVFPRWIMQPATLFMQCDLCQTPCAI